MELIEIIGLVVCGTIVVVFTLQVGYIRYIRARMEVINNKLDNELENKRKLKSLMKDEFVTFDDFEAEKRRVMREHEELHEYTVSNINRHIARNGRAKRKEEEDALMQQLLEFDTSQKQAEPVEPNGQSRRRLRRKRKRN